MKQIIPIEILAINHLGYHIMVKGEANAYKIHLLIDTGATITVMDLQRIKTVYPHLEIKPYNNFFMGIGTSEIDTYSTILDQFNIGDCKILNQEVILIDMVSINKAYAAFDLPRIDGVIGGDILYRYRAVINYNKAFLEMEE
ncbi:MAG: aspartyl protease family protein [Bacteroidales bacterium]